MASQWKSTKGEVGAWENSRNKTGNSLVPAAHYPTVARAKQGRTAKAGRETLGRDEEAKGDHHGGMGEETAGDPGKKYKRERGRSRERKREIPVEVTWLVWENGAVI